MIFSESVGKNDALYGNWQAPIRMLLEANEESCKQVSIAEKLFVKEKSTGWGESYTGMTAMDGFDPVGENGAYPENDMEQGYAKTLKNVTWKSKFAVSQEMVEDSKIIDFRKRPTAFMNAFYRTRENFAAAMLGGGIGANSADGGKTAVTFRDTAFDAACADGLALFSKSHPSKVKGGTQSNRFSNSLTAANLGLVETAMQNFKGDTGEILAVAPRVLLIPNDAALKKAAFEAVGSVDDPASSNNAWNYQYGRWEVWVWPYLNKYLASGMSPWILLDPDYNEQCDGLIWQDRVELTVKSYIDQNTDANVWAGRARFTAGFNDWRAVAVGGVTGGTELS